MFAYLSLYYRPKGKIHFTTSKFYIYSTYYIVIGYYLVSILLITNSRL